MKLVVTGRHLEVSPAIRQQIRRKAERLERLLGDTLISVQCVISQERGRFICEMSAHARGDHSFNGIGRDALLVTAVGLAVDKVAVQGRRLKDRWNTRRRAEA
jgi:putative sigma-54 modulation protein